MAEGNVNYGNIALIMLAMKDINDIAKEIINYKMLQAALDGDLQTVQNCLNVEANVNAKLDKEGYTALILAAWKGHTDIAKALIKAGADVNVKDNDERTALMMAGSARHLEVVEALIEAGADVNVKDRYGLTALDYAKANKYPEIVTILEQAASHGNFIKNEAVKGSEKSQKGKKDMSALVKNHLNDRER